MPKTARLRPRTARILIVLTILVITAIAIWILYTRPFARARVDAITLTADTPAQLANPANDVASRVIVVMPHDTRLSDDELKALAQHGNSRLVQFELGGTRDCAAAARSIDAAITRIGGPPDLVAGIGTGGEAAYRWLASQNRPEARVLAVELDITHPLCDAPIPQVAPNGKLTVSWNDGPDDVTARMLRNLGNAETTIGDYNSTAPQMLIQGIHMVLAGTAPKMPTIEVRDAVRAQSDTVTLFYSGDGGWRDLDRAVALQMTQDGYPVVGIDVLRYFWEHKSPEQGAADLARLMQTYRDKWGAKRFVLAGYSFGADVLPAIYNRLSDNDRKQVDAMLLLALARTGNFEIEVSGWLGKSGQEAQTGPELAKVPAAKILCVYGKEEIAESGCTLPDGIGERVELPGGHHFDEDYPKLARRLVQAIESRAQK